MSCFAKIHCISKWDRSCFYSVWQMREPRSRDRKLLVYIHIFSMGLTLKSHFRQILLQVHFSFHYTSRVFMFHLMPETSDLFKKYSAFIQPSRERRKHLSLGWPDLPVSRLPDLELSRAKLAFISINQHPLSSTRNNLLPAANEKINPIYCILRSHLFTMLM